MIRWIVCLLIWTSTATAQSLPERYSVTGVAGDDVLNIRSGPAASFDKIGEFGPYTLNVEVLRIEDGWGMVPAGERNGWVSMRFLEAYPIPANEVPRPLVCSGTEPFWTLALYPRGSEYNSPDTGRRDLEIMRELAADKGFLIQAREGLTLERTIVVNALPCNDGMSDRVFGMTATLFNDTPEGSSVQNGCCTFQSN
ncbi:MAG: hypothetical protein AAGL89_05780 [Pseudomonadota bacterium]